MYISKLAIINYKSCKNIVLNADKDTPNTLIGINDAGKSAILQAISCLFEPMSLAVEPQNHLSCDISNTSIEEIDYNEIFSQLDLPIYPYKKDSVIIISLLSIEETDIDDSFNASVSDQLKWSIESLKGNKLALLKEYNSEFPKGKYYICCNEGAKEKLTLWKQTKTVFDKLKKDLNVTNDEITNENAKGRFTNLEQLRAIYAKVETICEWCEYTDYTKKDRSVFPIFRYLDWKISLKDIQDLASDATTVKVEDFKKELIEKATILSKTANESINAELKEKTGELFKDLTNIKGIKVGINFNVEEEISDILVEKSTADGSVLLDSQGEGVKKQIWFAFLRWAALQNIPSDKTNKRFVWCFDEPEVHLYPSAQRELFEIIKTLCSGAFQIFISTHSTIFIDRLNLTNIGRVELLNGYTHISSTNDVQGVHDALGIRNSDILFFNKFLAIEGDTDQYLIPHFFELYSGKTIDQESIQIVNLHGADNRDTNRKLLEQIMKDFKKESDLTVYFLDGDVKDKSNVKDNECLIGKFDLEDSIKDEIWIKVVKNTCNVTISTKDLDKIRTQLSTTSEKKFYKMLSDFVVSHKDRAADTYMPKKGISLAKELKKYITLVDDIPTEIVETLKKFFPQ